MRLSSVHTDNADADPVQFMLQRVLEMAPGLSEAIMRQVEAETRAKFGGERHYVGRTRVKRPYTSEEQRRAAFDDMLNSNLPDEEIRAKHGISRATFYRLQKSGGR